MEIKVDLGKEGAVAGVVLNFDEVRIWKTPDGREYLRPSPEKIRETVGRDMAGWLGKEGQERLVAKLFDLFADVLEGNFNITVRPEFLLSELEGSDKKDSRDILC